MEVVVKVRGPCRAARVRSRWLSASLGSGLSLQLIHQGADLGQQLRPLGFQLLAADEGVRKGKHEGAGAGSGCGSYRFHDRLLFTKEAAIFPRVVEWIAE